MYNVFTRIGNGEFLFVASRGELEQAALLANQLKASWPNEYVVRDSTGKDVGERCLEVSARPATHNSM